MSDDNLFNDFFNDDSFRDRMNINPDEFKDENGEINYEKLREETLRIFEEFTGKKIEDLIDIDSIDMDSLSPSIKSDKMKMGFVQDLANPENKKMFNKMVEEYGLTKESKIVNMYGEDYVHEMWSNEDGTATATRMYKLDESVSSELLTKEERISIYQDKLEEAVEEENYEEAAKLRDTINKYKNE